jgi:hypothetical protein
MPGTGRTTHHQWPVPAAADEVRQIRDHITGLANAQDTELPKITYGTGAAPSTGMRVGDVHLQYVVAIGFDANAALPPDLEDSQETG